MSSNKVICKPKSLRQRANKSLDTKMRSINRIDEEIYEKAKSLESSLSTLKSAKTRLRELVNEIVKRENKIRQQTNALKEATHELKEAAKDMRELYTFSDKDQSTLLHLHTTLALEGTSIAQKQIEHIEEELDHMSPVVKESRNTPNVQCYDHVIVPEIPTNGMSNSDFISEEAQHPCTICIENEAECVLIDCGHICLCQKCASKFFLHAENKICPICRAEIKDVIVPATI